jgi:hypothetical protein
VVDEQVLRAGQGEAGLAGLGAEDVGAWQGQGRLASRYPRR